jgi:hypothetical protein
MSMAAKTVNPVPETSTVVVGGAVEGESVTASVFASLDEERAVGEAVARRRHLAGTPPIDFKACPRLTYLIKAHMTKCVDLRSTAGSQYRDEMLKAALEPDDQETSRNIGKYLLARGVDGIIFLRCWGLALIWSSSKMPIPPVCGYS